MQKIYLLLTILISAHAYSAKFYYADNFLTYYTTHEFHAQNTEVTRLVIVVHGALRNGDVYFADTVKSAQKHGVIKHTMIVAPHFRKVTDEREVGEIYYGRKWYQKWKYGYISQDSDQVSSFTLIDTMIKRISNSGKFPNLKNIVVTGHSAGGQFTQRYAVATKVDTSVDSLVEFVPSNPSSYMFLDKERYGFSDGNFNLLKIADSCSEYNEYIYGPTNRAAYLANYTVKELKKNFSKNKVTYLMSEEDKGTDSLDRSCEAMIQGENRFDRAKNYFHYDKKFIGGHQFLSIPGIGHEHIDVYNSKEAAKVVFGLKEKNDASYIYKKIGNTKDVMTDTEEVFVLLGGGQNELKGFGKFLTAANGGDVLVISAKDSLNHRYTHDLWNMSEEAGTKVDSVETISFLNKNAAYSRFVLNKIINAEAIFFTGGDQAKYISRIKGTPAHQAIRDRIKDGIPIAGTSAGLAIMGEYIFSAKHGGLSSRYVLKNPHAKEITIEKGFLDSSLLSNLVTDTHFMNRSREGRLLGFMFRAQYDYGLKTIYGVGVDEQTSVVITDDSMLGHGVGEVYFYRPVVNEVPSRQSGTLKYGPIKRLRLIKNKVYKHFYDLDYSSGDLLSL